MNDLQNGTKITKSNDVSITSNEVLADGKNYFFYEKAQELYCDKKYDAALICIKKALKMNAIHEDEMSLMYASDYLTLKGQIELHLNDYKSAYKSFESVAKNPTCYDELKRDMEGMMIAIENLLENEV